MSAERSDSNCDDDEVISTDSSQSESEPMDGDDTQDLKAMLLELCMEGKLPERTEEESEAEERRLFSELKPKDFEGFEYDRTPFWVACLNGHYRLVQEMLSMEWLDPDAPDSFGITPYVASMFGYDLKYAYHYKHDDEPAIRSIPDFVNNTDKELNINKERDYERDNERLYVVRKLLLCDKVDPNRISVDDFHPFQLYWNVSMSINLYKGVHTQMNEIIFQSNLFKADREHLIDIVRIFIEIEGSTFLPYLLSPDGKKPNTVGVNDILKDDTNVLSYTLFRGNLETLQYVLNFPGVDVHCAGAGMNAPSDITTIVFLMWEKTMPAEERLQKTQLLIDHPKVDINKEAHLQRTIIHFACMVHDPDIMEKFLAKPELDVNRKDLEGHTGLQLACEYGSLYQGRLLLKDQRLLLDELENNNILYRAIEQCQPRGVQLALEAGFDPNFSVRGVSAMTFILDCYYKEPSLTRLRRFLWIGLLLNNAGFRKISKYKRRVEREMQAEIELLTSVFRSPPSLESLSRNAFLKGLRAKHCQRWGNTFNSVQVVQEKVEEVLKYFLPRDQIKKIFDFSIGRFPQVAHEYLSLRETDNLCKWLGQKRVDCLRDIESKFQGAFWLEDALDSEDAREVGLTNPLAPRSKN